MNLKLAVLIKSVPDPKQWHKVTIDPVTKTIRKTGIPRVISPLDRNALEAAVVLKEKHGGEVTAICMGSPGARETVRDVLALGADRAVFLSDKAFSGADSLATARALAAALQKLIVPDLIFCGAVSYYGSTGQVGPQVAQMLGVNHFSAVKSVEFDGRTVRVETATDGGVIVCEAEPPLLLAVVRDINKPRGIRLSETVKARKKEILDWTPDDLNVPPERFGLAGSGTRMIDLLPVPPGRAAQIIEGEPEEIAAAVCQQIKRLGLGRREAK